MNMTPEIESLSEPWHTHGQLYRHRALLFCALAKALMPVGYTWKSKARLINGKVEQAPAGWFAAGIELRWREGERTMITFPLPLDYWDLFDGITREVGPPDQGYTIFDEMETLERWLKA